MVDKNPQILIVDDEAVVCSMLYDELSERGYLCTTAFNGNEALAKLATQDFDAVLLDIKLPGISGIEVLRKMQSNHPNTAAIMITGINDVDTAIATMKLGASDYIVKPFDLGRVNTSICTVLGTRKRHCTGGGEENKPVVEEFSSEMDAIARGIEAKYESLTGYSSIVTQRTIELARQLGIAEEEIQRWTAVRARLEAERNGAIISSLNKLRESPLAQCIMGMTEPHQHPSTLNES